MLRLYTLWGKPLIIIRRVHSNLKGEKRISSLEVSHWYWRRLHISSLWVKSLATRYEAIHCVGQVHGSIVAQSAKERQRGLCGAFAVLLLSPQCGGQSLRQVKGVSLSGWFMWCGLWGVVGRGGLILERWSHQIKITRSAGGVCAIWVRRKMDIRKFTVSVPVIHLEENVISSFAKKTPWNEKKCDWSRFNKWGWFFCKIWGFLREYGSFDRIGLQNLSQIEIKMMGMVDMQVCEVGEG